MYYNGEYSRSYSWFMRNSTSHTLALALNRAWEDHHDATGEPVPDNIQEQIDRLDISEHNVVGV